MTVISQNKPNLKTKVTLSISEQARLIAKNLGLNMSSILENALVNGLFSSDILCLSMCARENDKIRAKTEIISTMSEESDSVYCARFVLTPSENEENEFAILPYFMVKDLISRGFVKDETFTCGKHKMHFCYIKHTKEYSHLNRSNEKHKSVMFQENNLQFNQFMAYMSYMSDKTNGTNPFVKMPNAMPQCFQTVNYAEVKEISITDLFLENRAGFISWCGKSIRTPKTLQNYVKILEGDGMKSIKRPVDIIHYDLNNKGAEFNTWTERVLLKFFRYLEYINESDDEPIINGCYLSQFYKKLSILRKERRNTPAKNPKQKAINKGIKDAKELTVEDVIEEYNLIPDQLKPFYKLLVYSGVRASQLFRLLQSKTKKIEDKGDFIKVTDDNIQLGNKKLFVSMYAPKECLKYIKTFKASSFRSENNNKFTYENVCVRLKNDLSNGKRITAKSLRKFNLNFLRQNGVSGEVADYIQSRCDTTIRGIHYQNTSVLADAEYAKIVKKFTQLLPF